MPHDLVCLRLVSRDLQEAVDIGGSDEGSSHHAMVVVGSKNGVPIFHSGKSKLQKSCELVRNSPLSSK